MAKAERMGVALSLEPHLEGLVASLAPAGRARVSAVQDKLVLRPSKAVVEASDYLSHKHDWVGGT